LVTAGTGWLYANEAVRFLDVEDRVGILRIGTLSPLPYRFIQGPLEKSKDIVFLEEFDPYLETLIRSDACTLDLNPRPRFLGKLTGHLPQWGELTIDDTLRVVAQLANINYAPVSADFRARAEAVAAEAPPRSLTFCAGCPHRASYYAIYRAIKRNGNRGFVTGDIGCYSLGAFYHDLMRSQHAMGTGVGLASGFGHLHTFGLDEPAIAVIGDSTLYHAGLPALVNIRYTQSNATICVLDNQATAMTGFQPHPGTGSTASGDIVPIIDIEKLLRGVGFTDVVVVDPYRVTPSINAVYKAITTPGSHAIIFRRACPLAVRQPVAAPRKVVTPRVEAAKCLGAECRFCVAEFNCPALVLDPETNRVNLDSLLCVGCEVCTQVCPHHAIVPRGKKTKEAKR
jgi:indolepyruvate ferredoxin oxidoreductase alpha subunit